MYCDFFGFTEKPFTITPNPQFIFLSNNHKEAFAHLLYGIDSHAGFITLIGEVGTGKTTILRTLLAQLDPEKYRSALIFNPSLSKTQLMTNICQELGVHVKTKQRNNLGHLDALNTFLLEENRAGRTVVLVIDEAQNLKPEVLEQVRLISNLETERDKLIQIVLSGQPELSELLSRHELRQLNQRITVRYRLGEMNLNDTREYINHRLKVSGCRIPEVFTEGAVQKFFRRSGGIPRLVNVMCEKALVMAWTRNSTSVTPAMAELLLKEDEELRGEQRGVVAFVVAALRRFYVRKR